MSSSTPPASGAAPAARGESVFANPGVRRYPGDPPDRWLIPATAATLVLAGAIQLAFYRRGGVGSLSDLPHLFLGRGIRPGALPYLDRGFEYPVGAGILFYLATVVAPSAAGVLVVTAVGSAALCLWITDALQRQSGHRAWRWAVALPVALYAFQNWDVFAIAAMVFGLLAFDRRRDATAGAALGVGAAVKLFPAFVIVPLVAIRWAQGDRRGAARVAGFGALSFGLLNLPVLLANPRGWWWPYAFQSHRQATWGTLWFYGFRLVGLPVSGAPGAHVANACALAALAIGLVWLAGVTVRRRLTVFPAAAAAVIVFVLAGKVYSPTYDVWLVVFFVLVPVSSRLWRSFVAVDLAMFAVVYGYFHGPLSSEAVRYLLPVIVVVRALVLLTFLRQATRRPAVSSSPQVAHARVRP